VAEEQFDLKFNGPALEEHRMSVADLAPALLSLSDAFQSAQRVLYPNEAPVALDINATNGGSFAIDLLLTDSPATLAERLVNLFSHRDVVAAGVGVTIVTGIYAATLKAVSFVKWLAGRKIAKREPLDGGQTRITTTDGNTTIIDNSVILLVQDREFREKLSGVVKPLEAEGVDELSFAQDGTITERIAKSDAAAFQVPPDQDEVLSNDVRITNLRPLAVSFDGNKWRVTEGGSAFFAALADSSFTDKINKSEISFSAGDIIKVELRTRQVRRGADLSSEYTIERVIEVIPGARQIPLPFEEASERPKPRRRRPATPAD